MLDFLKPSLFIHEMKTVSTTFSYHLKDDILKTPLAVDGYGALKCVQYVLDMFEMHKELNELKALGKEMSVMEKDRLIFGQIADILETFDLDVGERALTYGEMLAALDCEHQLMAAIKVGGETHCVIVLDVDLEEKSVMVYAPSQGEVPVVMPFDDFADAWIECGNRMFDINNQSIS